MLLLIGCETPLTAQALDLKDSPLGLQSGSLAPALRLPDQNGSLRDFETLAGPKGLILVFFRSADWCIYCKTQLVQLERDRTSLAAAGFGLAAISYDSVEVLRDFTRRKKIAFALLSDHESATIRAFGVANRDYGPGTQLDVEQEIAHTDTFDNVPVYGIALPAVFVIGSDRKIQWRYVSEQSELRLTGASILEHAVGVTGSRRQTAVASGKIPLAVVASNTAVGLGNRIVIGVSLKIPSQLHVYGPAVQDEYRPLSWRMNPSACWQVEVPNYPRPESRQFEFADRPLAVYDGTLNLSREIILLPGIRAADPSVYKRFLETCVQNQTQVRISGSISFQACDRRMCYPPQSIPVEWRFEFLPPDRQRSPIDLRREFEEQRRPGLR